MRKHYNFATLQLKRELDERYRHVIQNNFTVTDDNIRRLGLSAELEGHSGCVNCLEWNESGTIIASGSDDVQINLWDPFRKKLLISIPSGHHGNIFSVKFVPNSGDRNIISGAADHAVRVHDVNRKELLSMCSCHMGRVKRLVTDPNVPHLFWSAGEDGAIVQHDLRTSHYCTSNPKKPKNVLIDLKSYIGPKAEAKCLAVNPVHSDYMAVGANDPFVRIYDRRMIKTVSESVPECVPSNAVQYLVPGHLPTKMVEYKRTYRSVASTYVAFSPDGKELLVNLGGEQIYLFPLLPGLQQQPMAFTVPTEEKPVSSDTCKENAKFCKSDGHINGYNSHKTPVLPFQSKEKRITATRSLPSNVEALKAKANRAFESKKYARAIYLYNEALRQCPNSPVLFGNRAAAMLKRSWDGDVYTALRDCNSALALDSGHYKAHLRLCRCLYELRRYSEAEKCLLYFKEKFSDQGQSQIVRKLEADIGRKMKESAFEANKASTSSSSSSDSHSPVTSTSSSGSAARTDQSPANLRNYFLRLSRASTDSSSSNLSHEHENELENESEGGNAEDENDEVMPENENACETPISSSSNSTNESAGTGDSENTINAPKILLYGDEEAKFKSDGVDFSARYCGHCNTTTDIKEANFFGNYIVAGSDDGSFFIWEKETSNIIRILKGDESIVNCLQPHPSTCLLATSGIESVVRLWSPLQDEEGKANERLVEDIDDAATSNQKRMASTPGNFLNLFLNMGYRLNAEQEQLEDAHEATMQCNST